MQELKRCRYCGEEILAIAVKCKHCGSSLEVSEPQSRPPEGDYGWLILGIPIAGVIVMWTWVANMSLIQGPANALGLVGALVVIATAAICALEASKLRMQTDRKKGTSGPILWGIAILLLWAICYPMYLFKRRQFGVANLLLPALFVALGFVGSYAVLGSVIDARTKEIMGLLPH